MPAWVTTTGGGLVWVRAATMFSTLVDIATCWAVAMSAALRGMMAPASDRFCESSWISVMAE